MAVGLLSIARGPTAGLLFYGNPNVTISDIDDSSVIASSRSSGTTPCFVQVSASSVTAQGTSKPFEDLSYYWDFGDATGTEYFTRPTDGVTVNANNAQRGPLAAYCYRSAGTYTVTLIVRGKNGSGYPTKTFTKAITVSASAPANEYWFDSAAADDLGAGTLVSPFKSITKLNTLLSNAGSAISSRTFHMKRGGTWGSDGVGIIFNNNTEISGIRFDAYGSGAVPAVSVNGSSAALSITPGGGSSVHSKSDIVFSNMKLFTTSGATTTTAVNIVPNSNVLALLTDIYFDNCTVGSDTNVSGAIACNVLTFSSVTNFGMWGCTFTQPLVGGLGNRSAFFGGADTYSFMVGLTISGAGTTTIVDHHIYPNTRQQCLFRWNTFGSGPNRSYCIDTNFNAYGAGLEYADYFLIAENDMANVQFAIDASNANNDPESSRFRNFVAELNSIHDLTAASPAMFFYCGSSMTVRYNKVWNCAGMFGPNGSNGAILTANVYGNRIYQSATAGAAAVSFDNFSYVLTSISNASPGLFSKSAGLYNIPIGTAVTLSTTGALPSPFVAGTTYYVASRPTPGSSLTLAATLGGADINTTTNGSGTHTLTCKWTAKQVMSNNIIQDARASGSVKMLSMVFADQVTATSTFDRDQLYTVAGATNIAIDGVTAKSLAQLQSSGFETSATTSNPNWADPANGSF